MKKILPLLILSFLLLGCCPDTGVEVQPCANVTVEPYTPKIVVEPSDVEVIPTEYEQRYTEDEVKVAVGNHVDRVDSLAVYQSRKYHMDYANGKWLVTVVFYQHRAPDRKAQVGSSTYIFDEITGVVL